MKIHITPPKLSEINIKEKITCIRGHRERMFNVSVEIIDGKLICHNYGQGGAGWTFLFGCVNKSIRLFQEFIAQNFEYKNKPITILGAGCYGLLTAIELVNLGVNVQIIADQTENLSSHKAAGFFFPRPRKVSNAQESEFFLNLGMESFEIYKKIINGAHKFISAGVKILPAYYALEIDPGYDPYIKTGLIDQPKNLIIDFGDKNYQAVEYQTLHINSKIMMQQLMQEVGRLGINIKLQRISNFNQTDTPIIFNCAGLGAKLLTHDARMVPVQGHLITLQNQQDVSQLQYMINFKVLSTSPKGLPRDEIIYFAPKDDGILGITFLRGQADECANLHEFDRLLERSRIFFGT